MSEDKNEPNDSPANSGTVIIASLPRCDLAGHAQKLQYKLCWPSHLGVFDETSTQERPELRS
jgi:hypothetical protein